MLFAQFNALDPTPPTRETLATMLEAGVFVRPRGRQQRAVYFSSISEWWLKFAKEDVTALMKKRRADGRRISIDDAIDEVASQCDLAPSTLRAFIQGKHDGMRRRLAKLKAG